MPIYKLLGGAARKRIRLYKDVGGETTEQLVESFVRAKAEGYSAAKSGFVTVNNDLVIPSFAVREGVKKLEAVRKAVGDDFDICIDAHGTADHSHGDRFLHTHRGASPLLCRRSHSVGGPGGTGTAARKNQGARWQPENARSPSTDSLTSAPGIW